MKTDRPFTHLNSASLRFRGLMTLALLCALVVPAAPGALIRLATGTIDTSVEPEATEPALAATVGGDAVVLVQFEGPIQPEWIEACETEGIRVGPYFPDNTYLATLPQDRLARLRASQGVGWVGVLPPSLKVSAALAVDIDSAGEDGIVGVNALSLDADTAKAITDLGGEIQMSRETQMGWHHTRATVPVSAVDAIAELGGVFYLGHIHRYELHGERAAQTAAGNFPPGGTAPTGPGYAAWLAANGLQGGPGLIVQVQDDGLDQGIATNAPGTAHPDILGRIAGIHNATTVTTGNGVAGHGQINAGIIMGNATVGTTDAAGHRLGQGMAPMASVFATKIFRDDGSFDIGSNSQTDLARIAQDGGATFSNNSWGCSFCNGDYNDDAAEFDALTRDADPLEPGNQPMAYFFSAGNSGPGGNTIGSPGTAKNVITVGAGENSDADGTDGCGVSPGGADSLRDLINFSSRGPDDDGRLSPTLFSVGTHVQGPASTDPGYDGTGVCDQFWPLGQNDYSRSSGTSHSTPVACGAGMIVHEYFSTHLAPLGHTANPSPAMIKAVLVATATDMVGGNDGAAGTLANIPNNFQGWGAVNLSTLVDIPKTSLFSLDQTHVFTGSGQVWESPIFTVDPAQPLRVTLAYTDAPATPGALVALVNNLDLEVISGGDTFRGNNFSGGFSTTGGLADNRNNVECVYIQSPAGAYTVRVRAPNIVDDGVPNVGGALDQDFALFVWNGTNQTSAGVVTLSSDTIRCGDTLGITLGDSDLQGAGTVQISVSATSGDSEVVTLSETIPNSGAFSGFILLALGSPAPDGVLQAAHGQIITATYNDADDGSDSPATATDMATVDCRPPVISSVMVTDVGLNGLTIAFDTDEPATSLTALALQVGDVGISRTGAEATSHSLAYDALDSCTTYFFAVVARDKAGNLGVSDNGGLWHRATTAQLGAGGFADDFEPAAEPGWGHSAAVGVDNWGEASSANAHSGSNVFRFAPGPGSLNDASLITPAIQGGGTLTFWHTFDIETGFDGAVIEISTNSGVDWTDLGSFITEGGYNDTISSGFSSPISGQMAWSGGTFGPMTRVMADLGSFPGSVLIRFRFASDSSITSGGWEIDDVSTGSPEPCTNDLPVAVDDTATTPLNTLVNVVVLDNDSDSDPLSVTGVTTPVQGMAIIGFDNSVSYVPDAGAVGGDSFVYTVRDDQGGAASARVSITVGDQTALIGSLVDYLLGLSTDSTGLNFNGDGVVDAADLVDLID